MGLAPTASTTAALAMGDALAVALIHSRRFSQRDFKRFHREQAVCFKKQLVVAVNVRTGKLAWRTRDFELANVVGVGRRLIILDQKGHVGLATPSPEGLGLRSKAKPLEQWSRTAPTVVGNVLYARDMHKIVALDLG